MAIYVVDTSVVIQRFIRELRTPEAAVLLGAMVQDRSLYVPELYLSECVNIFWKKVRFQGLPPTEAEQFINELLALPFRIVSIKNLLPRAFEIGLAHQLAIYDSLYIALALNLNCPLITVDDRQLNTAIANDVIIKPITDFSIW